VRTAVDRLAELDGTVIEDDLAPPKPLATVRATAVLDVLKAENACSVVDLGCGEGALLRLLVTEPRFTTILGVDVSHRALQVAAKRLGGLSDTQRSRIELVQSSLTYRDERLAGHDAVVLMEVIEHVDLPRLPSLERAVFGHAAPATVVVTTPNAEYNVFYPQLAAGTMRHRDHRFEWTRAEFGDWASRTAAQYGYSVRFLPVGPEDRRYGASTQLAVFRRAS
jgi:3' terminal RNA ribose 2'-O-methyltransferase Hen1